MDNNKNRMKDRPKSDAEQRKIKPKDNKNAGMSDGVKTTGKGGSKTNGIDDV